MIVLTPIRALADNFITGQCHLSVLLDKTKDEEALSPDEIECTFKGNKSSILSPFTIEKIFMKKKNLHLLEQTPSSFNREEGAFRQHFVVQKRKLEVPKFLSV